MADIKPKLSNPKNAIINQGVQEGCLTLEESNLLK